MPGLLHPSPGSYSSAGPMLHRVGQLGVQRVVSLHSARVIPYGRECCPQERWHLWCGRWTQHRNPGSCPFISLSPEPSLSLGDSNLLHPPSTRAQGEWLRTRFVHWAFEKVPVSLADSHLSLADRFNNFHSHMLYGHLFPAVTLWLGEPRLGLRPHAFRGDVSS